MNEILKDIQIICPRCAVAYDRYPSQSRRTNPRDISICSNCGNDEAIFDLKVYESYKTGKISRGEIKKLYENEGKWIKPWLIKRGDTAPRVFFHADFFGSN